MTLPPIPALTWRDLTWLLVVIGLIWAGLIIFGSTRPFWFDEVFTLGAAGRFPDVDWPVVRADVHPPGHVLLVSLVARLFDGPSYGVRILNLVGLAAYLAGLAVLARTLGGPRAVVVGVLIGSCGLTLALALELRAYGLLLGLSTLGHGVLLAELRTPRAAHLWLLGGVALALGALHFYGTLLGHALIGTALCARLWQARAKAKLGLGLLILGFLTAVFLLWAGLFLQGDPLGERVSWIALQAAQAGPLYLVYTVALFLANISPVLAASALVWLWRAKGLHGRAEAGAFWMLVSSIMVVVTGAALGLITPTLTVKNLIVCVPGLALAAVLWAGPVGVRRMSRGPVPALALALLAAPGLWKAVQPVQDLPWVLRQAADPVCDGVPLYTLDGGVVHRLGLQLYGGAQRPLVDLRALSEEALVPAQEVGCPTVAALFHVTNSVAEVEAFLHAQSLALTLTLAPPWDATRQAQTYVSHGAVLRLPSPEALANSGAGG
ncbi:MAG: hypothetical protein AAFR93_16210 [Pseudomonadota bacterium]